MIINSIETGTFTGESILYRFAQMGKSLVTLDIERVGVDEEILLVLQTGCPNLENFRLFQCHQITSLIIKEWPKLKQLAVSWSTSMRKLQLHCPLLETLTLVGCVQLAGKSDAVELDLPKLKTLTASLVQLPMSRFILSSQISKLVLLDCHNSDFFHVLRDPNAEGTLA